MTEPIVIYPDNPTGTSMFSPSDDVHVYVCRSNLFGSQQLGNKRLFHCGVLFRSGCSSWAIDLSIKGDMSSLLPKVGKQGNVVLDNGIVLGYYPPENETAWSAYWNRISDRVCTISHHQYEKLLDYILTKYVPNYDEYALFSVVGVPRFASDEEEELMATKVYTQSNVCDTLPIKCFRWLLKHHGVRIHEFPMQWITLSVGHKPEKVTNLSDPGLVAYAKEMDVFRTALADIASRDYKGLILAVQQIIAAGIPFLKYVRSYSKRDHRAHFYRLRADDVSLSVVDVMQELPQPRNNRMLCLLVSLAVSILFACLVIYWSGVRRNACT
jgi:hypothetical protein